MSWRVDHFHDDEYSLFSNDNPPTCGLIVQQLWGYVYFQFIYCQNTPQHISLKKGCFQYIYWSHFNSIQNSDSPASNPVHNADSLKQFQERTLIDRLFHHNSIMTLTNHLLKSVLFNDLTSSKLSKTRKFHSFTKPIVWGHHIEMPVSVRSPILNNDGPDQLSIFIFLHKTCSIKNAHRYIKK